MSTTGELEAQVNTLMEQLSNLQDDSQEFSSSDKKLLSKEIEFYSSELRKIDGIFSDFTTRIGVLITCAGLLSFLPTLLIVDPTYLPYFLKWTFWILIFSIFTYYPSSLRVQSIIKGIGIVPDGHFLELASLHNRKEYLKIIWKKYIERYESVLWWNRATVTLIYAYIFSLVINFYIFVFYSSPSVGTSVEVLLTSILLSLGMIKWQLKQSERNKVVGDVTSDIATGSPPADL